MCTQQLKRINGRLRDLVWAGALVGALAHVGSAPAQIVVPGGDGSDGVFIPPVNTQVDLSLAATRNWDAPSPVVGRGVYDSAKWAVVFKYASVNIPAGVTVTFNNHPSGAPVVWLVQGSVTIAGELNLDGRGGHGDGGVVTYASPGPGGFRGGKGRRLTSRGSAGFGPGGAWLGGGRSEGSGAGYADPGGLGGAAGSPGQPYGNARVIPLVGGSGGAGGEDWDATDAGGGGGGGGAILIASGTSIEIRGSINARGALGGGNYTGGGGSGGAIRLIANTVSGAGLLQAYGAAANSGGGYGAAGRIRIEANSMTLSNPGNPAYTIGDPDPQGIVDLWPAADAPSVRVVSIGGREVPTDPRASFTFPVADVSLTSPDAQPVIIAAKNVPLNWQVDVHVVPVEDTRHVYEAFLISGNEQQSTWEASVRLANGFAAVQVRAYKPAAPSARGNEEPPLMDVDTQDAPPESSRE